MNIDAIYIDFCNKISEIIILQRTTKSIMNQQIQELNKYLKKSKEFNVPNFPIRIDNMFFVDYRTGERVFFGQKSIHPEEYLKFIQLKSNRDYQFYLASAYEKFEDTIELIYAYLGKNDINFWPLSEYGQKKYDNVKSLDSDFFITQAKNKKGGAIQIFKTLLQEFDCDIHINPLNLKTEVILIEKLRHLIIHNSGLTSNKDKFIHTVMKESGILNNGNIDNNIYKYIENIFGRSKYDKLILLLDRILDVDKGIPIDITINIFENLVHSLVFAVHVICEKTKNHLSEIKNNS